MSRSLKTTLWIVLYFLLALSPLIVLLVIPRPPLREFWREFAVALGFAGLALMGLQFIPTARLPILGSALPTDTVYHFHHHVSLISMGLILAHPAILILNNPYVLQLLNLATAPWRARAGVTAALGVVVLVVLSVWRKQLRVIYEAWRISHAALAVLACGLAMWHIFGVRYYLDLPVQRVFWIAWAVVWTAIVLYVRVVKPWLQLRHPYRVVEMIPEHGAAWTLVVEPVGHEGMTFRAGQVAWLNVQRSPFGFEQHPFSFSSSAEHPERLSFTIKELGDFTSTVSQIPVGTEVSIDGPYGTFGVECGGGQGYVLVAGGIGSAPMMSMLRTIADRGERCSIYFFYGNRTWDDVIFREELAALEERISLHVNHVLEIPPEGWTGDTGYVTQDLLDRRLPENRAELMYMISGPLIMIELVEKYLVGLGIPRRNIHSERYEMA